MGQDLKKLFKNEKPSSLKMREGHEARFLEKLEKELPKTKKNTFFFMKIAAAAIVLIVSGFFVYTFLNKGAITTNDPSIVTITVKEEDKPNQITLGNISPELKKVEDYYIANINLELSQIEITEENKQLLDGYMQRLNELNDEYNTLGVELNQVGPNEQNITSLINNLQIRLQLLYRLKDKLKELKETQNETITKNQI